MRVRISLNKGFFPLLLSSLLVVLYLGGCAENSSILNDRKSRQLEFSVMTYGWNNSNKSSAQKVPSRATPISGSTFDTSKSFNVIADVNKGGSWSTEVNNETASYSTANNIWQTSATHYWPGSGSIVNFYAYYPTSILNKITHTSGSAPVLSYTVPDNAADQIDILTSAKPSVAGDSYNQTPVDFKHIFAAVQFRVGSSGLPSGTISSITISGIKNSGTYTFGNGWTLNSGTTTFKVSPSTVINGTSGENITAGIYTLMMIPQTLSNATITLNYDNGTTFSTTISGTWTAGNIYTYQLSKSIVYNFDYTGGVQSFTAPYSGTYKLEVWGAQGINAFGEQTAIVGKGGYSYGNIKLKAGQEQYVCVGGSGYNGGYNGGVNLAGNNPGGGATHISTTQRGELKNYELYQREVVIVAGGGGSIERAGKGGDGGGLTGDNGNSQENSICSATGGSQTSGGTSIAYPDFINSSTLVNGSFGEGGYGYTPTASISQDYGASGGGGWYGGGGTSYLGAGGGGSGHLGSSLISGTTGMQNGVRSGNGYARITFISAN